ncbi:MAG TPA: molybdopterin-dependent oxidoreductase [Stellaceae bacterium]
MLKAIFRAALLALVVCGARPVLADDLTIVGPDGPHPLAATEMAKLATVDVTVSFMTQHGTRKASFSGPLLWDVLTKAGAIDVSKPKDTTREIVSLTGSDNYVAVLAVGEISPEFEGKDVILATSMDGKPLDPNRLRVVVPLDKRGGRSVRDVVKIEVTTPH